METLRPSVWHELRETFADRAINVRTLPRTLRVVVGAAYAQIIVAVVLLAVRAFGLGSAPTQLLTIQGQHMPAITYGFVLLAVAIAWATILTGAFLAHPVARVVLLATFTLFFRALSNASGDLGGFLAFVLVTGLWIALFVSLFRKPTSFEKTFVPFFIAIVAIGLLTYAGSDGPIGIGLRFGASVTYAMGTIVFVLFIVLAMAGGELGDWAQLGGTGIGAALVRVPRARVRALIVASAALLLVGYGFETAPISYIVSALPLIAVAACVVAVVAYSARRFGTPRTIHVPWFAIAGASVLYAIPLAAGPIVDGMRNASNVDYVAYESGEHREKFRLDMPTLWHEVDFGSSTAQGSYFSDARSRAAFAVVAFPLPEARVPKSGVVVAAEEQPSRIVSSRVVGYDREFLVKKAYGLQRIVVRRLRNRRVTFQLESRDTDADYASERATFDHIRDSFKAGDETNPHDGLGALGVVLMTIVGLGSLLALLRRFTVAATFFAIFSMLYVGENIDHFVAAVMGGTGSGAPVVRLATVEFATGTCALLLLAILGLRRHPAFGRASLLLGSTIAGFATLQGLFALYGAALAAGEISLAQAAIVFLALSWDIVMSGESITNGDSKAFPRAARLGMFLGYVMLVAAVILFFASLRTLNGEPASSFESEGIVRFGIIALGIPILLTAFVIRIVASLQPACETASASHDARAEGDVAAASQAAAAPTAEPTTVEASGHAVAQADPASS